MRTVKLVINLLNLLTCETQSGLPHRTPGIVPLGFFFAPLDVHLHTVFSLGMQIIDQFVNYSFVALSIN